MEFYKFNALQKDVQEIIDAIAIKDFADANIKLINASEILDEILDFSDDDADLIEISKYQVLLNQLQQRINGNI